MCIKLTDEEMDGQLEWYTPQKVEDFRERWEARERREKKERKRKAEQEKKKPPAKKAKAGSHAEKEQYTKFYLEEVEKMFETLVEAEIAAHRKEVLESFDRLHDRLWNVMQSHLKEKLWVHLRAQNKPTTYWRTSALQEQSILTSDTVGVS